LQALRKEPLTVYGDGKQTRSFQYVSDLVIKLSLSQLTGHIMPIFTHKFAAAFPLDELERS
jgi:UDP-glucuronate decarboxylase